MNLGDLFKWYPSWVDPGLNVCEIGLIVGKDDDGWLVLWQSTGSIDHFAKHHAADTEIIQL